MALNIRNQEVESLAAQLAELTGETKTCTVKIALSERLERVKREQGGVGIADKLNEIALRCAALPVLDERDINEILPYDDDGLPS